MHRQVLRRVLLIFFHLITWAHFSATIPIPNAQSFTKFNFPRSPIGHPPPRRPPLPTVQPTPDSAILESNTSLLPIMAEHSQVDFNHLIKTTDSSEAKPNVSEPAPYKIVSQSPMSLLAQESPASIHSAMGFLRKFGYLEQGDPNSEALYQESAVIEAIKHMQVFGGLNPTGKIDNDTIKLMATPRCGNKDQAPQTYSRVKRYVIGGAGWNKRKITYNLANYSPKLGSFEDARHEIHRAFQMWSRYAHLKFVPTNDPNADIVIYFGRAYHGDAYPFDGPGMTLAHAYYPYEFGHFGGDVHFDEDEAWMVNITDSDNGVDFFTVATHELGHSLGLSHSPVSGSIMYPYYKGHQPTLTLDYDDILAMYQLYIARYVPGEVDTEPSEGDTETTTPRSETTTATTTRPRYTTTTTRPTTKATTTTTTADYDDYDFGETPYTTAKPIPSPTTTATTGVTYNGDYETVDEHKKRNQIPELCDGNWDVVTSLRSELFIFKGSYVWRFSQRGQLYDQYPVHFRYLFWNLPDSVKKIDAVYERRTDGKILFFSGKHYWVFDGDKLVESQKPLTTLGLPKELDKLDAAFVWGKNGKTYFFRDKLYWRYDEVNKTMERGYPDKMDRWRGIPSPIDSVLLWTDGSSYFFKGKQFWKFDDLKVKVNPKYPWPAPQYWAGCEETENDFY